MCLLRGFMTLGMKLLAEGRGGVSVYPRFGGQ